MERMGFNSGNSPLGGAGVTPKTRKDIQEGETQAATPATKFGADRNNPLPKQVRDAAPRPAQIPGDIVEAKDKVKSQGKQKAMEMEKAKRVKK
jgi:hypothetical protein